MLGYSNEFATGGSVPGYRMCQVSNIEGGEGKMVYICTSVRTSLFEIYTARHENPSTEPIFQIFSPVTQHKV